MSRAFIVKGKTREVDLACAAFVRVKRIIDWCLYFLYLQCEGFLIKNSSKEDIDNKKTQQTPLV